MGELETEVLDHVVRKISTAEMNLTPFPHLLISGILPQATYEQLMVDLPGSDEFVPSSYPGTGFDTHTKNGVEYGLILPRKSLNPTTQVVADVVGSRAFADALLTRFSSAPAEPSSGGIPLPKYRHFAKGATDFTTVFDIHRDLPGYEISPHRDVSSKIITFLLSLEPDDLLAEWGTHLCAPKIGVGVEDVESSGAFRGHRHWRDWELFDTILISPSVPNSLLVFAPHDRSYHAVKMDIPTHFERRERTTLRGFIRSGSNKPNYTAPYEPEAAVSTQETMSPWKRSAASARLKFSSALRRSEREALRRGWKKRHLDALVVSSGGAGTTTMLHWLRQWITVNHPRSFEDGLKHLGGPTHPALDKVEVDRVVLLVADPRETVLSLFRRGYSDAMPAKLASHHRTPREYSQFVADNRRSLSFEAFLEAGVDSFGFEQHWNDWSCRTHPRPTMIVRYEHIPEALPSLLEFLGLPGHLLSEFPAWTPRQSSLEQLSTLERTRLHHIYGDLANRIAAEPPWSIHQS